MWGLRKLFFSTYLLGASLESMQKQKVVGLKKNKNLLSSTNLATVAHQKQNIAYCKTIPSYLSCCEAAICDLGAAFLRRKANRRRYSCNLKTELKRVIKSYICFTTFHVFWRQFHHSPEPIGSGMDFCLRSKTSRSLC